MKLLVEFNDLKAEYQAGNFPGAQNVSFEMFKENVQQEIRKFGEATFLGFTGTHYGKIMPK